MATVHVSESEVSQNSVEDGNLRSLSECIAIAETRGSKVTLDEGFMKDVEEGIAARSQPWKPPLWE